MTQVNYGFNLKNSLKKMCSDVTNGFFQREKEGGFLDEPSFLAQLRRFEDFLTAELTLAPASARNCPRPTSAPRAIRDRDQSSSSSSSSSSSTSAVADATSDEGHVRAGKPKRRILLPYMGKMNPDCCDALLCADRTYPQCPEKKEAGARFCSARCAKVEYGTIQDRMEVGIMDYTERGKKVNHYSVHFRRQVRENNVTKDEVLSEAAKQGIELDDSFFEAPRPVAVRKSRTRGNSSSGRTRKRQRVENPEQEADADAEPEYADPPTNDPFGEHDDDEDSFQAQVDEPVVFRPAVMAQLRRQQEDAVANRRTPTPTSNRFSPMAVDQAHEQRLEQLARNVPRPTVTFRDHDTESMSLPDDDDEPPMGYGLEEDDDDGYVTDARHVKRLADVQKNPPALTHSRSSKSKNQSPARAAREAIRKRDKQQRRDPVEDEAVEQEEPEEARPSSSHHAKRKRPSLAEIISPRQKQSQQKQVFESSSEDSEEDEPVATQPQVFAAAAASLEDELDVYDFPVLDDNSGDEIRLPADAPPFAAARFSPAVDTVPPEDEDDDDQVPPQTVAEPMMIQPAEELQPEEPEPEPPVPPAVVVSKPLSSSSRVREWREKSFTVEGKVRLFYLDKRNFAYDKEEWREKLEKGIKFDQRIADGFYDKDTFEFEFYKKNDQDSDASESDEEDDGGFGGDRMEIHQA